MAIGMAILGGLNMGMSIWAAQQKRALDMQAADEMENIIFGCHFGQKDYELNP